MAEAPLSELSPPRSEKRLGTRGSVIYPDVMKLGIRLGSVDNL